MIVIVDYGLGNLISIQNMIKKIGFKSIISSNKELIMKSSKLILPGVGAFDEGINNIEKKGLKELLTYKAKEEKVPFLGICLGMQLMLDNSEEGDEKGLGFISGVVKKIPENINSQIKVPHIGWNFVKVNKPSFLFKSFEEKIRFYFVHSYYVELDDINKCILKTKYGLEFVSAYQDENIYGVQFHPEKSHRYGKLFLKNFIENT